ncbi:TPA: hypothetical protein ACYZ09_004761 [Escherichia coli]
MDCVFKKALENEVDIYKRDNDINSFLQYLHYFDIDKVENYDECTLIIMNTLSIHDSFELLMKFDHDFGWLFNKVIERRSEYLSSDKKESDFKKYSIFINSLDLKELNYNEISTIHSEIIKGIEDFTYGEVTI